MEGLILTIGVGVEMCGGYVDPRIIMPAKVLGNWDSGLAGLGLDIIPPFLAAVTA